ncbi:hypothetical protein CDAR_528331 [Caerostris darwini]|uniref:Uncharacterized protein n=1 Tax=Caerostris darwini TaxID=1538125 RepID=A0AAV4P6C2_9ARAC|nr:hypothetical protein CDAR_528331 [Caerostris darwini]
MLVGRQTYINPTAAPFSAVVCKRKRGWPIKQRPARTLSHYPYPRRVTVLVTAWEMRTTPALATGVVGTSFSPRVHVEAFFFMQIAFCECGGFTRCTCRRSSLLEKTLKNNVS